MRLPFPLRQGVSKVEADIEVSMRHAAEQDALVAQAEEIISRALEERNEAAAQLAGSVKVNAERQAKMYRDNVQRVLTPIAEQLKKRLQELEVTVEMVSSKANTIRTFVNIAEANKALYNTISQFNEGGLTPAGNLAQLHDDAERDMLASSKMIELAGGGTPSASFLALTARSEADKAVDDVRKQRALPKPVEVAAEPAFSTGE